MPLRDHFRSPVDDRHRWEGFHAMWPAMIVSRLRHRLPGRCLAEPSIHSGSSAETAGTNFDGNGPAWMPGEPTLALAAPLELEESLKQSCAILGIP